MLPLDVAVVAIYICLARRASASSVRRVGRALAGLGAYTVVVLEQAADSGASLDGALQAELLHVGGRALDRLVDGHGAAASCNAGSTAALANGAGLQHSLVLLGRVAV